MRCVSGNRAIRDHAGDGKDLHLFKQVRKGYVQYVGQMVCTGSSYKEAPDTQGHLRKAIVFELTPIAGGQTPRRRKRIPETEALLEDSLETLRQKALAESAEASRKRDPPWHLSGKRCQLNRSMQHHLSCWSDNASH